MNCPAFIMKNKLCLFGTLFIQDSYTNFSALPSNSWPLSSHRTSRRFKLLQQKSAMQTKYWIPYQKWITMGWKSHVRMMYKVTHGPTKRTALFRTPFPSIDRASANPAVTRLISLAIVCARNKVRRFPGSQATSCVLRVLICQRRWLAQRCNRPLSGKPSREPINANCARDDLISIRMCMIHYSSIYRI